MKLREWRETKGLSQEALVKPCKARSATTVSRWERGVHIPHPDQMIAVFQFTDGAVDPNSFYELPKPGAALAQAAA